MNKLLLYTFGIYVIKKTKKILNLENFDYL